MSRVLISNLSYFEYEHPKDKSALDALRKVPALPNLVDFIHTQSNIISRYRHSSSFININERQLPSVFKQLCEACDIIEVDVPAIYLSPETNY